MKSYIVFVYLFICGAVIACNNAGQTNETTDSSTIRSTQDNTRNADTSRMTDTSSYDRMHQKQNDSSGRH